MAKRILTNLDKTDDQQGIIGTALSGSSQWTTEALRDTGFIINWLRHDQDDFFQMNFQFTHRKKIQSPITSIHLHYMPAGSVDGNVFISYSYTWVNIDGTIPALTSWTTSTVTIPVAGADQYKHKIANIVANILAPSNETASSILLIKCSRLGSSSGSDTYTSNKTGGTASANFGILYMDAHILTDRAGTDTELT